VVAVRDSKDEEAKGTFPANFVNSRGVEPAPNGTFEMSGLVPGKFRLYVQYRQGRDLVHGEEVVAESGAEGVIVPMRAPDAGAPPLDAGAARGQ
jgi:hypothetical protein